MEKIRWSKKWGQYSEYILEVIHISCSRDGSFLFTLLFLLNIRYAELGHCVIYDPLLLYLGIYVVIFNNGKRSHEPITHKCLTKTRGSHLILSLYQPKKRTELVTWFAIFITWFAIFIKHVLSLTQTMKNFLLLVS